MQRFGSACVLIVKATENEGNVLRYRHALRPLFASVVPYGPADRGGCHGGRRGDAGCVFEIRADALMSSDGAPDRGLAGENLRPGSDRPFAPATEAGVVSVGAVRIRRLPAEDKSRGESGWSELLDDSAGEAAVRVARIKAGLNELPDGCRLILSLCLFEGYDYAEIAEITGLKTSSVRSQYTRAKGKLLEKLQRDG